MKQALLIVTLIISVSFLGCTSKISVSGTVKYPDGSPLKMGSVIFEQESYQVFGIINEDGTYKMGEDTKAGGIKPGTYKVRVSSRTGGGSDGTPLVKYIADKYENTNTSGLTCEVKGKTEYNIEVEKAEE